MLETRRHNFQPLVRTWTRHNAQRYRQTDGQTTLWCQ